MENLNIPDQLDHTLVKTVTQNDTADRYGSGLLEVFATPAMVAFMEQTCHSAIQAYLPSGYSSVGTELNIRHLKATPVGDTFKCTAKLQLSEGRKLVFSVSVIDSKGLVGEGTHTRFIIDLQKFMAKLS